MSTQNALVTGASGFVGSHVAELLLKEGHDVRVLVRPTSNRDQLASGLEVVEGDLRDPESLRKAVQGRDTVYHVAADYRFWAKNPRELYDNNVQGTDNILRASRDAGVKKFVYTSTVGTIGLSAQPAPCDETTPIKPGQFSNHYKLSKWEAEKVALGYAREGFPVVIVNPSTPIGPGDAKPTPTGQIIVDFMRGKIPAYVNTGLNFVDVRDVARGHLLAAEKGRIGERYILGNQNMTMLEFLELLGDLTQRAAPRYRIPYPVAWMAGALSTAFADLVTKKAPAVPLEAVKMSKNFMFFDTSKSLRELGVPQSPVRQAAAEALTWFAIRGYFGAPPAKGANTQWQSL
ncbi:MAG: NAD-dependent epimerase/dehydratase family protein [Oligoflexia bacterium]|nr:NAD-dependent epimerase/dehydratase family protein [Oligoflexia bacterium]